MTFSAIIENFTAIICVSFASIKETTLQTNDQTIYNKLNGCLSYYQIFFLARCNKYLTAEANGK